MGEMQGNGPTMADYAAHDAGESKREAVGLAARVARIEQWIRAEGRGDRSEQGRIWAELDPERAAKVRAEEEAWAAMMRRAHGGEPEEIVEAKTRLARLTDEAAKFDAPPAVDDEPDK